MFNISYLSGEKISNQRTLIDNELIRLKNKFGHYELLIDTEMYNIEGYRALPELGLFGDEVINYCGFVAAFSLKENKDTRYIIRAYGKIVCNLNGKIITLDGEKESIPYSINSEEILESIKSNKFAIKEFNNFYILKEEQGVITEKIKCGRSLLETILKVKELLSEKF